MHKKAKWTSIETKLSTKISQPISLSNWDWNRRAKKKMSTSSYWNRNGKQETSITNEFLWSKNWGT